jgi:GNAT superfamily N-acetyltransferase
MATATILPASVETMLSSGLIEQLDADLLERYPGESINGIDPSEFRAVGGYFVVAWLEPDTAGCGAFRPLDKRAVEIKRMFVQPQYRGRGIARAILAALETKARSDGYVRAVLETAVRQPEAIALYRASGYSEIEPFGPYIGSSRSVCFSKVL